MLVLAGIPLILRFAFSGWWHSLLAGGLLVYLGQQLLLETIPDNDGETGPTIDIDDIAEQAAGKVLAALNKSKKG